MIKLAILAYYRLHFLWALRIIFVTIVSGVSKSQVSMSHCQLSFGSRYFLWGCPLLYSRTLARKRSLVKDACHIQKKLHN